MRRGILDGDDDSSKRPRGRWQPRSRGGGRLASIVASAASLGRSAQTSFAKATRTRRRRVLLVLFFAGLYLLLGAWRVQWRMGGSLPGRKTGAPRRWERVYVAAVLDRRDGQPQTGEGEKEVAARRRGWNEAVLGLVDVLGKEDVFVSVTAVGGLMADSEIVLKELGGELEKRGVRHEFARAAPPPPAKTNGQRDALGRPERESRVPWLAKARNRALERLGGLVEGGEHFDKVVFLEDGVFTTRDILNVLGTRGGQYAAACPLDLARSTRLRSSFALRDDAGRPPLTRTWPYFWAPASRAAVARNDAAVKVRSCWGDIVAMPAHPFLARGESRLRFRSMPESLVEFGVEAADGCIVHADNPLSASLGVYLNPRVRVAATRKAYRAANASGGNWLSAWAIIRGSWGSGAWEFLRRDPQDEDVEARVSRWRKTHAEELPEAFCLADTQTRYLGERW